ncbi:MAG: hypothetical protein EXQ74_06155 [Thermoleophilia bacterium]|nr:hypothetical protein [Thermoleophilia bacterium]
MAHTTNDRGLPQVWPFTLGGLFIVIGLIWFQIGFAVHDSGKELWGHYGVFWAGLLVGVVLIVVGGVYNTVSSRRRSAAH